MAYLAQEWMDKQNHSMLASVDELELMAKQGVIHRYESKNYARVDYLFEDTSVVAWKKGRSLEVL